MKIWKVELYKPLFPTDESDNINSTQVTYSASYLVEAPDLFTAGQKALLHKNKDKPPSEEFQIGSILLQHIELLKDY